MNKLGHTRLSVYFAALFIAVALPIQAKDTVSTKAISTLSTFKDCDECSEMVVLPAGQYMMGATKEEFDGQPKEFQPMYSGETPRHLVRVESFAIGRFHITRKQFAAYAKETGFEGKGCRTFKSTDWRFDADANWQNPGFSQTDDDPVVCVSWNDTQKYIQWLNNKNAGKPTHHYRLPTEEEWEYAVRAGTTTPTYWGNRRQEQCHYENTRDETAKVLNPETPVAPCNDHFLWTSPVGSFKPNPWKLFDMLGNARQWMSDCSPKDYHDSLLSPPKACPGRVVRGGSWASIVFSVRSAMRGAENANKRSAIQGFRIAADL